MYDPSILLLLIVGFLLVLGAGMALTTFGNKYPKTILVVFLSSLAVYVSVILVRIGAIDLTWMLPAS